MFISLDTEDPPRGIPAVYPDVVEAMEFSKTDPEAAAAKFQAIRASMGDETGSTDRGNITDAQALAGRD